MKKLISFYKNLIVRSKKWIFLVSGVFLFGFFSGVLISLNEPDITRKILSDYVSSIDPNLEEGADLASYIFFRNASIVLMATLGGFVLGLVPIFIGFINGLILGALLGFPQIYSVLNPFQLLMLLLPHGIIEYTGSLLGLAFGVKLGLNWLRVGAKGKRLKTFLNDLKEALVIGLLSLVLLTIAAFIEGFLTTDIACFVARAC